MKFTANFHGKTSVNNPGLATLQMCHIFTQRAAGPARVRWGLPRRAYPAVWPPDAAARSRQEGRGQGRNLSQRAVPLTVGQASGQGQQGRARGRACEHPPPSMLTAPAANNRPLCAAAQEHKRAAGLRSARPHHTPRTHRTTATRPTRIQVCQHWPLPDCARWAHTACHHA